jgi:nicotinate-nucleotide adenylyltransferase
MKNIGFFGVTANPPHKGHLQVVQKALTQIDEVWISPVYQHPFGKKMINYERRLHMLELLFQNMHGVRILEVDKEYYQRFHQMPYSYDLLQYLQKEYHISPKLIIGEDNYQPAIWNQFYRHVDIEKDFGVLVVHDEGTHSTKIRHLYQQNQDIAIYCGEHIANYLKKNKILFEA